VNRSALLLLLLAGCPGGLFGNGASATGGIFGDPARITRTDFQAGTLEVCGRHHATMVDLEVKARQQCPKVQVLRCGEQVTGAVASTFGSTTVAHPVSGLCCEYQCLKTK
jgi:hypothetical protein